jgi:polyisoprenyl-phosphate glycosyltransferase
MVLETQADRDRGQGARRQALLADQLSRNFGHQIAITVGLDHAAGRAVIVIDADLQDPPEVVLEMIAKWKEGYDVVSAERASRQGESRFKRATANLFYRLMGRLGDVSTPRNAGDLRLVDRQALRRPRDGQRRH